MEYEIYFRFRKRHPKEEDDDEVASEFEIRKKLMLEAFPDKGTDYVLERMKAKLKETHENKIEIGYDCSITTTLYGDGD